MSGNKKQSCHLFRKRVLPVLLFSCLTVIPIPCFPQHIGKCYYRDSAGISIRYIGGYPRAKQITVPVAGAVPGTFRLIADSPTDNCSTSAFYGTDGLHVFFRNKVIEGANPDSFQAYAGGYSADGSSLFFRQEKVPHASPQGFHTVQIPSSTSYYGITPSGILYNGRFIRAKVDVATFSPLGGRWVKDRVHVYLRDNTTPIKDADPATFMVFKPLRKRRMNLQWAKDKTNVYHITSNGVETLSGASPDSFTLINRNYAKDHQHVYYQGRLVVGADPRTFIVPNSVNSHTGYDKYHKYHLGKEVPGTIRNSP